MANFTKIAKAAGLGLALTLAGQAQASVINVGGVNWDPDAFIDFTAQSDLYEKNVNAVGDVLYGVGVVTSLNGQSVVNFCPGCQLTFEFGYTVAEVGDFDTNGTVDVIFDNGYLNFYVDSTTTGTNFDFTDVSTAVDGALWLGLVGHTDFDPLLGKSGQLFGELDAGFALTANNEEGKGSGLLDVAAGAAGGLAAGNFDTNTRDDFFAANVADFNFTSEFQPFVNGGTTADGLALAGTGTLLGSSIPEPGSLALLGLGLLGLGGSVMKRRKA